MAGGVSTGTVWRNNDAGMLLGSKSSWQVTSEALGGAATAGAARAALLNEGARSTHGLSYYMGGQATAAAFLDHVLTLMGVAAPAQTNATPDDYRKAAVLLNFPLVGDGLNTAQLFLTQADGEDVLPPAVPAEAQHFHLTAADLAGPVERRAFNKILQMKGVDVAASGDLLFSLRTTASEATQMVAADTAEQLAKRALAAQFLTTNPVAGANLGEAVNALVADGMDTDARLDALADHFNIPAGALRDNFKARALVIGAPVAAPADAKFFALLSGPDLAEFQLLTAQIREIEALPGATEATKAILSSAGIQAALAAGDDDAIKLAIVNAMRPDADGVPASPQLTAPQVTALLGDGLVNIPAFPVGSTPLQKSAAVAVAIEGYAYRDNAYFLASQGVPTPHTYQQLMTELRAAPHNCTEPQAQEVLSQFRTAPANQPTIANALGAFFVTRGVGDQVEQDGMLPDAQNMADQVTETALRNLLQNPVFQVRMAARAVPGITPEERDFLTTEEFIGSDAAQKLLAIKTEAVRRAIAGNDMTNINGAALAYIFEHLDPALADGDMATVAGQNAYLVAATESVTANAALLTRVNAFDSADHPFTDVAAAILGADPAIADAHLVAIYDTVNPVFHPAQGAAALATDTVDAIKLAVIKSISGNAALTSEEIVQLFDENTFGTLPVPVAGLATAQARMKYAAQVADYVESMLANDRENFVAIAAMPSVDDRRMYLEIIHTWRLEGVHRNTIPNRIQTLRSNTLIPELAIKPYLAAKRLHASLHEAVITAFNLSNPVTLQELHSLLRDPQQKARLDGLIEVAKATRTQVAAQDNIARHAEVIRLVGSATYPDGQAANPLSGNGKAVEAQILQAASPDAPVIAEASRNEVRSELFAEGRLGSLAIAPATDDQTRLNYAVRVADQVLAQPNHANLIRVAAEAAAMDGADPASALAVYQAATNAGAAGGATIDSVASVIRGTPNDLTPLRRQKLSALLQNDGVFAENENTTEVGRRNLSIWLSNPENNTRYGHYVAALNALDDLADEAKVQAACRMYAVDPNAFELTTDAGKTNFINAVNALATLTDSIDLDTIKQQAVLAMLPALPADQAHDDRLIAQLATHLFQGAIDLGADAAAQRQGAIAHLYNVGEAQTARRALLQNPRLYTADNFSAANRQNTIQSYVELAFIEADFNAETRALVAVEFAEGLNASVADDSDAAFQRAFAGLLVPTNQMTVAAARIRELSESDTPAERQAAAKIWVIEHKTARAGDVSNQAACALTEAATMHLESIDEANRPAVRDAVLAAVAESAVATHLLPAAQRADAQAMVGHVTAADSDVKNLVTTVDAANTAQAAIDAPADVAAETSADKKARIQTKLLAALKAVVPDSEADQTKKCLITYALSQVNVAQLVGLDETALNSEVLKQVAIQVATIRTLEAFLPAAPVADASGARPPAMPVDKKLRIAFSKLLASRETNDSDAQRTAAVQGAAVAEELSKRVQAGSDDEVLTKAASTIRGGSRLGNPLLLIGIQAGGATVDEVSTSVTNDSQVPAEARAAILKVAAHVEAMPAVNDDHSELPPTDKMTLLEYVNTENGSKEVRALIAQALGVTDSAVSPNPQVDLILERLMASKGNQSIQDVITDPGPAQNQNYENRRVQVAKLVIAGLAEHREVAKPDLATVANAFKNSLEPIQASTTRSITGRATTAPWLDAYTYATGAPAPDSENTASLAAMRAFSMRKTVEQIIVSEPGAFKYMSLGYQPSARVSDDDFKAWAAVGSRLQAAPASRPQRVQLLAKHVHDTLNVDKLRLDAERVKASIDFADSVAPALPAAPGAAGDPVVPTLLGNLQAAILADFPAPVLAAPAAGSRGADASTVTGSSTSAASDTPRDQAQRLSTPTAMNAVYLRHAQLHQLPPHLMAAAAKQFVEANKERVFDSPEALFKAVSNDLNTRRQLMTAIKTGLTQKLASAPDSVPENLQDADRTQMYAPDAAQRKSIHDDRVRALRAQMEATIETAISASIFGAAGPTDGNPSHQATLAEIKSAAKDEVAQLTSLDKLDLNAVTNELMGSQAKYAKAVDSVLTAMKLRSIFLQGRDSIMPADIAALKTAVASAAVKLNGQYLQFAALSAENRKDWLLIALKNLEQKFGLDPAQMRSLMGVDSLRWDPRLVGASGDEEKLATVLIQSVKERLSTAKSLYDGAGTYESMLTLLGADNAEAVKTRLAKMGQKLPQATSKAQRARFVLENLDLLRHVCLMQKAESTLSLRSDTTTPEAKRKAFALMVMEVLNTDPAHPALANLKPKSLHRAIMTDMVQRMTAQYDREKWGEKPLAEVKQLAFDALSQQSTLERMQQSVFVMQHIDRDIRTQLSTGDGAKIHEDGLKAYYLSNAFCDEVARVCLSRESSTIKAPVAFEVVIKEQSRNAERDIDAQILKTVAVQSATRAQLRHGSTSTRRQEIHATIHFSGKLLASAKGHNDQYAGGFEVKPSSMDVRFVKAYQNLKDKLLPVLVDATDEKRKHMGIALQLLMEGVLHKVDFKARLSTDDDRLSEDEQKEAQEAIDKLMSMIASARGDTPQEKMANVFEAQPDLANALAKMGGPLASLCQLQVFNLIEQPWRVGSDTSAAIVSINKMMKNLNLKGTSHFDGGAGKIIAEVDGTPVTINADAKDGLSVTVVPTSADGSVSKNVSRLMSALVSPHQPCFLSADKPLGMRSAIKAVFEAGMTVDPACLQALENGNEKGPKKGQFTVAVNVLKAELNKHKEGSAKYKKTLEKIRVCVGGYHGVMSKITNATWSMNVKPPVTDRPTPSTSPRGATPPPAAPKPAASGGGAHPVRDADRQSGRGVLSALSNLTRDFDG